jgi:hypothetical protein
MLIIVILAMIVIPAALTLHTVHLSALNPVAATAPTASPHGYTVSLLLFLTPILVIALWLIPQEGIKISKKSFLWTMGLLFPIGAGLDFFFAHYFFTFPNANATLGIKAPALGFAVPIEEYVFYLTGSSAYFSFTSGSTNTGSPPTTSKAIFPTKTVPSPSQTASRINHPRYCFNCRIHPLQKSLLANRLSRLLHLPGAHCTHSLISVAPLSTRGHQLASLQPHSILRSPRQPYVGGYARHSLWLVELSRRTDVGSPHHRMG